MGIRKLFIFIFLLNSGIVHARQQIPFGFFRPAAADVTPDTVDWEPLTIGTPQIDTNTQTINGISQSINLRFRVHVGGFTSAYYSKNGGAWVQLPPGAPSEVIVSVSNGDTLTFRVNSCVSPTWSVYNDSDGSLLIDQIAFSTPVC